MDLRMIFPSFSCSICAQIDSKCSFDKQSTMQGCLVPMDAGGHPSLCLCQQTHGAHCMLSCCGGNKTFTSLVPSGQVWHLCHCAKVYFQCFSRKSASILSICMPKYHNIVGIGLWEVAEGPEHFSMACLPLWFWPYRPCPIGHCWVLVLFFIRVLIHIIVLLVIVQVVTPATANAIRREGSTSSCTTILTSLIVSKGKPDGHSGE